MTIEQRPSKLTPTPAEGADASEDHALSHLDTVDEWVAPEGSPASLSAHRPTSASPDGAGGRLDVPDIIGMEVLDAHRQARRLGLRLAVSVWETAIGPWGMVLSQYPARGSSVRSGARVHVVVAGQPHLTLPDVTRLQVDAAMRVLREVGLHPVRAEERTSRTVPRGHVISTRPRPGTLVVDASRVWLVVSRATVPIDS